MISNVIILFDLRNEEKQISYIKYLNATLIMVVRHAFVMNFIIVSKINFHVRLIINFIIISKFNLTFLLLKLLFILYILIIILFFIDIQITHLVKIKLAILV